MRTLYLYDRWENQIGVLSDLLSARHKDDVDASSEDSITLDTLGDYFEKGQRVIWRDRFGKWHEQIIADLTTNHTIDGIQTTAYGENSLSELIVSEFIGEYIAEATPTQALTKALSGTRWKVGDVELTDAREIEWYFISPHEALQNIKELWGGEYETEIKVEGSKVVSRTLHLRKKRGRDTDLLFEYGFNMTAIKRSVETADVYTAMYGLGKSMQVHDDAGSGLSRKVTFGEMNSGRNWVGDEEAREKWGIPDGSGGKRHSFGKIEFSDVVDPRELMELTKAELAKHTTPSIAYTGTVVAFEDVGITGAEDVDTGDMIHVRDKELGERFESRAVGIDRDLLNEENTTLTIGNFVPSYIKRVENKLEEVDKVVERAPAWDDVVSAERTWLDYFMDSVNSYMNEAGGYVYWEQGVGITIYDRPVDLNPSMAMQLTGAGFRIANSKNPDGSWRWRTFGTGNGFTADLLTVGTIQGGSNTWNLETGVLTFEQGSIESADGKSKWDLTKNTFVTDSMTANDMTANGTFLCGTAQNGMKLTSDGKLAGYRNGKEVGYINYAAEVQTHAGTTLNGLLISGGAVGLDIQAMYVKEGNSIYNAADHSGTYQVVRNVTQAEDKTISLATGDIYAGFNCGICTMFDVY